MVKVEICKTNVRMNKLKLTEDQASKHLGNSSKCKPRNYSNVKCSKELLKVHKKRIGFVIENNNYSLSYLNPITNYSKGKLTCLKLALA